MSFIPMLVVVAMVMGMGMKMGCLFVGVLLIHTVPTHPTALEDQKTRSTFDKHGTLGTTLYIQKYCLRSRKKMERYS